MSEQFGDDNLEAPQQNEPDVVALLKKIQQQLVFLEKKVDSLLNQSGDRPPRDRGFSKPPFRSFGHSHRPNNDGNRDSGPRGNSFPPRRFGGRDQGESRGGFGPRRKPFPRPRRDRD